MSRKQAASDNLKARRNSDRFHIIDVSAQYWTPQKQLTLHDSLFNLVLRAHTPRHSLQWSLRSSSEQIRHKLHVYDLCLGAHRCVVSLKSDRLTISRKNKSSLFKKRTDERNHRKWVSSSNAVFYLLLWWMSTTMGSFHMGMMMVVGEKDGPTIRWNVGDDNRTMILE